MRSDLSPAFSAVNRTMPENHASEFNVGSIPIYVTITLGVVLAILSLTVIGYVLFVLLIRKRKKIKSITIVTMLQLTL